MCLKNLWLLIYRNVFVAFNKIYILHLFIWAPPIQNKLSWTMLHKCLLIQFYLRVYKTILFLFCYDDSLRNLSVPSNSSIILKDRLQITTELTFWGDGFPGGKSRLKITVFFVVFYRTYSYFFEFAFITSHNDFLILLLNLYSWLKRIFFLNW